MREGAEDGECFASYPERGHLVCLTDDSPTAQRAAVSQALVQNTTTGTLGEQVSEIQEICVTFSPG